MWQLPVCHHVRSENLTLMSCNSPGHTVILHHHLKWSSTFLHGGKIQMKWAKKWVQIWTHHNFITFSYKCDPLLTSKLDRISASYKRNWQDSVFTTLWRNCEENMIHVFSAISHFHDIFITMLGKCGLLNFVIEMYFTNLWHFYHNVRKMYFVMKMWYQIWCH